nr:MAG TPA: hypothetical protein [Caudoviricetes sp.]
MSFSFFTICFLISSFILHTSFLWFLSYHHYRTYVRILQYISPSPKKNPSLTNQEGIRKNNIHC